MVDEFIAVDVETANYFIGSVCQIGITVVEGGAVTRKEASYIDSGTKDFSNSFVHSITYDDVRGSPDILGLWEMLRPYEGWIAVSHSSFDRRSLFEAWKSIGVEPLRFDWLDTVRVARRAWPKHEGHEGGHSLGVMAKTLGLKFKHHDAGEDSFVAACVMLEAIKKTGIDLADWSRRCDQQIDLNTGASSSRIRVAVAEDGPLADEVICFTGALQVSRREAAQCAANLGGAFGSNVTRKTTILVVGDLHQSVECGELSSKHKKALELIAKGQKIRIIDELDFWSVVST